MKNVLCCVYYENSYDEILINDFLSLLKFLNYDIDLLSIRKSFRTDLVIKKSKKDININKYDIVIAINSQGYNQIIRKINKSDVPLIYVISNNENSELLFNLELCDKILLINNTQDYLSKLLLPEIAIKIAYPFYYSENISYSPIQDFILVCTDIGTVLRTIPIYNKLHQYHFVILTDVPNKIKKLVNSNIQVYSFKNADKLIRSSKILIGSGHFILKGLHLGKTSLVLGENGFGGLVTSSNFENHFSNYFLGRVGAQFGEYIPENLVSHEIVRVMDFDNYLNDQVYEIQNKIRGHFLYISRIVNDVIISSIRIHKSNIWNLKLVKSQAFILMPLKTKQTYLVINERLNKIHSEIAEEEFQIISCFNDIRTPRDVFKLLFYDDEVDFIIFIKQLIKSKIIVPNEESTN